MRGKKKYLKKEIKIEEKKIEGIRKVKQIESKLSEKD